MVLETRMKRLVLGGLAAVLFAGLAGCETATPYQPLNPSAARAGGYSETKVEADRWRVSFAGNSVTSRETVETYLLYRASELTLAQGYDWFTTTQRSTERHDETDVMSVPGPYDRFGPWGPWGPRWRVYGGWGWRSGYWGDPFWGDINVQNIERYDATVEVVMGRGHKPQDDKHAFDAHEVQANLAGKIVKPPH